MTNNVEFARQKAREVFVEGNIPICPHLLFPPVADPTDPAQDEKARAMGLRLLESCQQMNVYGPVWTDGMWQEIYKAGGYPRDDGSENHWPDAACTASQKKGEINAN